MLLECLDSDADASVCGSGLGTRIVLSVTLFVVANGLHKNMFRVCVCSHIHVVDHEKNGQQ